MRLVGRSVGRSVGGSGDWSVGLSLGSIDVANDIRHHYIDWGLDPDAAI